MSLIKKWDRYRWLECKGEYNLGLLTILLKILKIGGFFGKNIWSKCSNR
jgi:hypothetical protein